jgi:hypothetical protein
MAVPEKSGTAFSSHKFCEAVRFWPVGLVKPSRSFGSSAIVRGESSSCWGKAVREVYCATCRAEKLMINPYTFQAQRIRLAVYNHVIPLLSQARPTLKTVSRLQCHAREETQKRYSVLGICFEYSRLLQ